ncbi:MAG TPA: hypothetical protein VKA66_01670, partial [Mycobacterium sp.]|nr:hypothetical protein [Mycobacterium sp.]
LPRRLFFRHTCILVSKVRSLQHFQGDSGVFQQIEARPTGFELATTTFQMQRNLMPLSGTVQLDNRLEMVSLDAVDDGHQRRYDPEPDAAAAGCILLKAKLRPSDDGGRHRHNECQQGHGQSEVVQHKDSS